MQDERAITCIAANWCTNYARRSAATSSPLRVPAHLMPSIIFSLTLLSPPLGFRSRLPDSGRAFQVSLALDMARGVQALHDAPGGPIVHFDIKPHQMMLDDNGRLKINDLNMCSFPDADKDGNSCPYEALACSSGVCTCSVCVAGAGLF